LACQSGREVRALDLCQLMDERTLQSAIKYAVKMSRLDLAESIHTLLENKQQEQEEEQQQQQSQSLQSTGGDLSLLNGVNTNVNFNSQSLQSVTSNFDSQDSVIGPTPPRSEYIHLFKLVLID